MFEVKISLLTVLRHLARIVGRLILVRASFEVYCGH